MNPPSTSHKRGRYHHGNLPAALVEAAIEVVAEVGVEALTLREVAHRVGVTHAAPYRHFKGKGVLLAAVAEEGFARLTAAIETARRSASERFAESTRSESPLSDAGAAYLRFACQHAALYRLMFAAVAEESTAGLRTASNALLSEIAAAVRDTWRRESIDVEDTARLLWSCWHGLATLHAGELLNASAAEAEALASAAADRLLSTSPPLERPERTSSPRIATRGPDSSAPHPIASRVHHGALDDLLAAAASGMGHDDEPSR